MIVYADAVGETQLHQINWLNAVKQMCCHFRRATSPNSIIYQEEGMHKEINLGLINVVTIKNGLMDVISFHFL